METANNEGWGSNVAPVPERDSPAWIVMRDAKLAAWEASKKAIEDAKAEEMRLRKEFVDFAFDPGKREGTERIELHNGYEAKAVKKLNYGFRPLREGQSINDAVDEALSELEKSGPQGKFVADRLVKWTAALSLTEYRELSPEHKAIFDKVVETKDAAPTLEIVAPKGKR